MLTVRATVYSEPDFGGWFRSSWTFPPQSQYIFSLKTKESEVSVQSDTGGVHVDLAEKRHICQSFTSWLKVYPRLKSHLGLASVGRAPFSKIAPVAMCQTSEEECGLVCKAGILSLMCHLQLWC